MFDDYFAGKRVLVTGIGGVKGSWLGLMLLRAGAVVTGIDKRRPELRSNFMAAGLDQRIEFVHDDVRNLKVICELVNWSDCVFHLAAEALVGETLKNPLEAYSSNVAGTATVLEALRLAGTAKRAVFVTTDKVYKPKQGERWIESDELGASGPYAVSKACAEWVIRDYIDTYFRHGGALVGVGRAGNVVIGGDLHSSRTNPGAGRIFVDCFDALASGRSPEIFRPDYTRPFTYGLDILSGYMTLMSRLDTNAVAGNAFNFGPHEQLGVRNALLATKICDLWASGVSWTGGPPREEPFDLQSLSIEKSRNLLGWHPAFTLYEALDATTAWYKRWAGLGEAISPGCMYDLDSELIEQHRAAAARLRIEWAISKKAVSAT